VIQLVAVEAFVLLVWMLSLWFVSVQIGDPSFIDAAWAFGFVLVAAVAFQIADGDPTRKSVLLLLTTAWGIRLGGYLLWRWRKQGPDRRYVRMLEKAPGNKHVFTLTRVFLLQGVLLWLVSMPVQLGQLDHDRSLTPVGYLGIALALVGIAFETIGDAQLVRFKADETTAGQVLDTGLWRYTRHPNYFGDTCVWWGLFQIAVTDVTSAFAVVGPIVLTFLLLRYSGAPITERHLHRSRPGYADYVQRTSSFIPRRPRARAGGEGSNEQEVAPR
jgi:steroid 5-alpha reductase family enzyme